MTLTIGGANPAAPSVRNLGNYHGTGEPFVNRTFESGVLLAAFLFPVQAPACPSTGPRLTVVF
eukprot:CAMPEP_0174350370 /NCGR_PEP_ID=MMETSP0811_2-20130205/7433_1 /TAXON_ID=73025 ORGANISM="Eutreptiella gymnastica-like, Strain CCMP1594" /NCGR_SAMPLE_ID=MMETSP0811_2 /ASSEMBLY_ACC=CAM_ASM_000667 /LENGTH=62 /DNA_ID=CAMNT_0015478611 /DNA_START=194 /DNA_END=379 /DNA_ORIENTATION=+